jgi:hypothetical protein
MATTQSTESSCSIYCFSDHCKPTRDNYKTALLYPITAQLLQYCEGNANKEVQERYKILMDKPNERRR